jgi:hypothetical protein
VVVTGSLPAHAALTGIQRWLESWWPSARLRRDPLSEWRVDDRYAPVSIANWKLTPRMARLLLERRVAQPLSFSGDEWLSVVIPFRDRGEHLHQLLPRLTATLTEQRITHRVIVVEQEPGGLFNRGKLLNIGIHHAAAGTDYYCLHDVDAVPIVANYRCPSQPLRLMNTVRGSNGDSQRTNHYFSGAISLRKEQVFAANGYSNEYWGWGKEDDDFFFRLLLAGFLCFYDTQGIFDDLPNPKAHEVVRTGFAMPEHVRRNRRRRSRLQRGLASPFADGLNTLSYEVTDRFDGGSYEKIRVRW